MCGFCRPQVCVHGLRGVRLWSDFLGRTQLQTAEVLRFAFFRGLIVHSIDALLVYVLSATHCLAACFAVVVGTCNRSTPGPCAPKFRSAVPRNLVGLSYCYTSSWGPRASPFLWFVFLWRGVKQIKPNIISTTSVAKSASHAARARLRWVLLISDHHSEIQGARWAPFQFLTQQPESSDPPRPPQPTG